jgi:hypothetical protein
MERYELSHGVGARGLRHISVQLVALRPTAVQSHYLNLKFFNLCPDSENS